MKKPPDYPSSDELMGALKAIVAASSHIPVFGNAGATVQGVRLAMKYVEALERAERLLERTGWMKP